MKYAHTPWRLLAGAAVGLLAFATAGHAQSWEEVVTAANAEGKVVFLHNLPQGAGGGADFLVQEFNKEFPKIQVEHQRLSSGQATDKFDTEFNAARHLNDVVVLSPSDVLDAGLKKGWAAQWTPPEITNFDAENNDGDMTFAVTTAARFIIWNKNFVKDADAPSDWADLADPRFKGKVGMSPPWRTNVVAELMVFIEDKVGIKDYPERLKENGVQFFEGSGGVIQAVVRGDIHVAETGDIVNDLIASGAPLGFAYAKSGTTTSPLVAFVAAQAPHPNAGKVFLNWMLSENGQKALTAGTGMRTTRIGSPSRSHLPAATDIPNAVPGRPLLAEGDLVAVIERWRKLFEQ